MKVQFMLFLISLMGLIFICFFFGWFIEPKEKVNCIQVVVADKFVDSDNQRYIILKNDQEVESARVTIEEFYSHEVGDEVEACFVRGKYTKLFGVWRIEE